MEIKKDEVIQKIKVLYLNIKVVFNNNNSSIDLNTEKKIKS